MKIKSYKQKIAQDEWDQVQIDSEAANELLKHPKFAFLRNYLSNTQQSIEKTFTRQSINDAAIEENTIVNGVVERVKRIFLPARKEYSHLAGEYKFIERFLSDVQKFADLATEARKQRDAGVLEIVESKEN